MRLFAGAGEISGDILAASIINSLKKNISIFASGVAGNAMIESGVYPLAEIDRLSLMGLVEVLPRLVELHLLRINLIKYIDVAKPNLILTVDAPDFFLPLAKKVRKNYSPVVHCVSPSVWAWRSERVKELAKNVSHLLCLFPFEPKLYESTKLRTTFIGHPTARLINFLPSKSKARLELGLNTNGFILGVFPGSRLAEVYKLFPIFIETIHILRKRIGSVSIVVPAASERIEKVLIKFQKQIENFFVIRRNSLKVLEASDVALVASGTVALESILTGRPTVAAYKLNPISFRYIKNKMLTPWITLPNQLAGTFIVPEFIQEKVTPKVLAKCLVPLLLNHPCAKFLDICKVIHSDLSVDREKEMLDAIFSEIDR